MATQKAASKNHRAQTRARIDDAAQRRRSTQAGIGELRVIISYRDGFWFARGLEIDYAAQGVTRGELKRNFEQGLSETIALHLRTFGTLENLLRPSPAAAWQNLHQSASRLRRNKISVRKFPLKVQDVLKFQAIRFFEFEPEAAVA